MFTLLLSLLPQCEVDLSVVVLLKSVDDNQGIQVEFYIQQQEYSDK